MSVLTRKCIIDGTTIASLPELRYLQRYSTQINDHSRCDRFMRNTGMKNIVAKKREWIVPELVRLGRISDVAGSQAPLAQSAGNVKS